MCSGKLVASLDVIVRLLSDPDWKEKARGVKTLKEMRRILLEFGRAKGNVVQVDKETLYIY